MTPTRLGLANLLENTGVSRIAAAAMNIRATKSLSELTGVSYTRLFTHSRGKKSTGDKPGDLEGRATGQPRPIHLFGNIQYKLSRTHLP
ncbi:hypothetical protein TNCV_2269941 [Trichonephila clavipes]|nr:hypothetical protein TNCV_2269941 [Trichonephila clavipes]